MVVALVAPVLHRKCLVTKRFSNPLTGWRLVFLHALFALVWDLGLRRPYGIGSGRMSATPGSNVPTASLQGAVPEGEWGFRLASAGDLMGE